MADRAAHSRLDGLLQSALASKEAGSKALQAGDLKRASFCYKRVYLYLVEYLPAGMVAKTQMSSGSGADGDNAGLVALLGSQKGGGQRGSSELFAALPVGKMCAVVELYGTTQNNLALVNLRLQRYREGVACATCVLEQLVSFLPNVDGTDAEDEAAAAEVRRVRNLFEGNTKALLRRASCYVELGEYNQATQDLDALETLASARGTPLDVAVNDLRARITASKKAAAQREKKLMQKMFA